MTTPTQEALAALKRLSSVFYNKPPPGFAADLATIRAALEESGRFELVAYRREWDGDVSDEGQWIYEEDRAECDPEHAWQPWRVGFNGTIATVHDALGRTVSWTMVERAFDAIAELERQLAAEREAREFAAANHAADCVAMIPFVPSFGHLRDAIKLLGDRAVLAESRLAEAVALLREITDKDPIDLALDPQWAQRMARAFLSESTARQEEKG